MANRRNWREAILLGLISSSYSTLISQFAAARLGRDAAVDWMSVAAIPARDWALQVEPSWSAIAIGIAFHQWADFSWALVFFGALGRKEKKGSSSSGGKAGSMNRCSFARLRNVRRCRDG